VNADIIAGTTLSIEVTVEDGGDVIFQDGDLIRISDKSDINDGTGSAEFATISGVPSYAGDIATITIAAGLTNPYLAVDTRVESVMTSATVGASHTTPSVDIGSGTVDDSNNPIVDENIGAVDDNWTVTFTSTTGFNLVRDVPNAGDAAHTGTTGTPSAPINSDTGSAYFTIPTAFWGGSWVVDDEVTFSTTSATFPIWEQRVIPAGTTSLTANSVKLVLEGESAE
jgi:hypothetical protein